MIGTLITPASILLGGILTAMRGISSNMGNMFTLFLMFCRKKGIEFDFSKVGKVHQLGKNDFSKAPKPEDKRLFDKFFKYFFDKKKGLLSFLKNISPLQIAKLKSSIYSIDDDTFESSYRKVVDDLIMNVILKDSGDFSQPEELSEVVSSIVSAYGCNSIYNPCSGVGSYAISSPEHIKYYGQEINDTVAICSMVRIDAYGRNNATVECTDSFRKNTRIGSFDAIVSTPPFDTAIDKGIYLDSAVAQMGNADKLIVDVVVQGWNFSERAIADRTALCRDRKIAMIILLPSGLFSNTSVATEILVIDPKGGLDSLSFVDARKMYTGSQIKDRKLDSKAVISAIQDEDKLHLKVPYAQIYKHSCVLSYDLYKAETSIPAGETVYPFKDAACRISGKQTSVSGKGIRLVRAENLNCTMVDINAHMNDTSLPKKGQSLSSWKEYSGHFVAFGIREGKMSAYIHNSDEVVLCPQTVVVYRVHEDFIPMEQFVYYVLNCVLLIELVKGAVSGREYQNLSMALRSLEEFGLTLPTSVEDRAERYNKYIREENARKKAELQAEMDRYGIKSAGADIVHMLGTPFVKQNRVIDYLVDNMPEDNMTREAVSALIDISKYIQRITENVGKDFDNATFNLERENISDVVSDYVESWNHFCGDYFQLTVNDRRAATGKDVWVMLDKDKFFILLDTILDNAYRHGFDKNVHNDAESHHVVIDIDVVKNSYGQCALICIGNDGKPLEEGFSINDYISRGRFGVNSGRTGLGGNHIYTIVKRHGGHIGLDGNKNMPFIVRIVIPLSEQISTNIKMDSYEGYV